MTPEQVEEFLKNAGWIQDRYGHFHKNEYRIKFQSKSIRLEKSFNTTETAYSKSEKRWVRLRSNYFGKLSIVDGKLAGLER